VKTSIYTSAHLNRRIAELEVLSLQQEEDLKSMTKIMLDDLKPMNLIKNAFSSTVKSPGFGKNLLRGIAGLAVGFITKKIFVMGSSNIVKKALGTVVELSVAKAVAKNADKITSTGVKMLNKAIK
jgi:hypothetical protein